MDQLLEGYLRALATISSHSDGGFSFDGEKFDKCASINKWVESHLIEDGWERSELPSLEAIDSYEFPSMVQKFMTGLISQQKVNGVVTGLIDILNEQYAPFKIYAELDDYEYGKSLVMVLESESENVFINLDWSYD
jgi:hypothetical protein